MIAFLSEAPPLKEMVEYMYEMIEYIYKMVEYICNMVEYIRIRNLVLIIRII